MTGRRLSQAVLVVVIGLALFSLSVLVRALWWPDSLAESRAQAVALARDVAACLGILTIIVSALQWVSQRSHDATRLGLRFMLDFYEDERMEGVRRALRDRSSLTPLTYADADGHHVSNSMRYEVVRLMNYFEAVAIAVRRGSLDRDISYRMLGSPMSEAATHPQLGLYLRSRRFSYEAFTDLLVSEILPRKKRELGKDAAPGTTLRNYLYTLDSTLTELKRVRRRKAA